MPRRKKLQTKASDTCLSLHLPSGLQCQNCKTVNESTGDNETPSTCLHAAESLFENKKPSKEKVEMYVDINHFLVTTKNYKKGSEYVNL